MGNKYNKYTDESLLQYIRDLHEQHGKVPQALDFKGNPLNPSPMTYTRHFGSWSKAVRLAGYLPRNYVYSDKELLNVLVKFFEEHGRVPKYPDLRRKELPDGATYKRRFGSLITAIELAGLEIPENNNKTDVENLSDILRDYYYSGEFARSSLVTNIPILVDFESYLIEVRNKQGFQELELSDMIEYFNHLETKGVYDAKRDQKANSVNTLVNKAYTIAGFLTWDEENDVCISKKTRKKIRKWIRNNYSNEHRTETTRVSLTESQVKTIFKTVRHPILRFVFWLGLNFGLRREEYTRIKREHIDLESKRIKIYGKSKGNIPKERILTLTDEQVRYLNRQMKQRMLFRPNHDYLITTRQGKRPYRNAIWKYYKEISKKVGFRVTPHDVRYTAAKIWEKAQNEHGERMLLSDIQKMLGHANLRVTSLYLRSGIEELEERVENVLGNNQNKYW